MTPSEPSCLQVLFCWWSQMSEQKPRARLGLGFSTVSSPVWFIYLLISIFNNVCYFNHPTIIYCYYYYYFNMESTLKCSIVGKVAYRNVEFDFIQVHFGCSEEPRLQTYVPLPHQQSDHKVTIRMKGHVCRQQHTFLTAR